MTLDEVERETQLNSRTVASISDDFSLSNLRFYSLFFFIYNAYYIFRIVYNVILKDFKDNSGNPSISVGGVLIYFKIQDCSMSLKNS